MFFLLRMTFWIGLVCVLLPGTRTPSDTAQIDTSQAVSAATATYSDMRGFCARQADACAVGGQVATVLGHRAQEGAKTIVEFISQQMSETAQKAPVASGTLTAADAAPAFSAPASAERVPLPPVAPRREAQNRRPTA